MSSCLFDTSAFEQKLNNTNVKFSVHFSSIKNFNLLGRNSVLGSLFTRGKNDRCDLLLIFLTKQNVTCSQTAEKIFLA